MAGREPTTREMPRLRLPSPYSPGRPLPEPPADKGPEKNSRLTAMTAIVLLVLLAVEGVTVLRITQLLNVHILVGMLLVPPVLLKMGSTFYRFARYYLGSPAYRRRGPPPPLLRLLGPVVVVTTVALFASGIALVFATRAGALRSDLLLLHKGSFVVWFGAMTLHVLAHILETAKLAPLDWYERTRSDVSGARLRQWAVAFSLAAGVPLGLLLMGRAGPWLAGFGYVHR